MDHQIKALITKPNTEFNHWVPCDGNLTDLCTSPSDLMATHITWQIHNHTYTTKNTHTETIHF